MNSRFRTIFRTTLHATGILKIRRMFIRKRIVKRYLGDRNNLAAKWIWQKTEYSNFYYDLENLNMEYLSHFLGQILGIDPLIVIGYFEELENDLELEKHFALIMRQTDSDITIKYGRRHAWYAIARAKKPQVIVETGVEHGVGSCILTAALLRNMSEGYPGKYYGTELNPSSGIFFQGKYATIGEIIYGDSVESLKLLDVDIDLFINDSDHSAEYENLEYNTVIGKLTPGSIILGDNAHVTNKLAAFSSKNNRKFLFFSEKPKDHWYPGGGVGISFI